jgi:hypothetical protein
MLWSAGRPRRIAKSPEGDPEKRFSDTTDRWSIPVWATSNAIFRSDLILIFGVSMEEGLDLKLVHMATQ